MNTHSEEDQPTANEGTGKSAGDYDGGKAVPPKSDEFNFLLIDTVGGIASGIVAGILFSTGDIILGLWVSYIGLVSVLHIPFRFLINSRPAKKTLFRSLFGATALLIAAAFVCWTVALSRTQVPPPKPKLSFAFFPRGERNGKSGLELTNDFLFIQRGAVFRTSELRGVLLVPIKPGQSSNALVFGLIKNNENLCEMAQLDIESDGQISFGKGWNVSAQPSPPTKSAGMMEYDRKTVGRFRARFPPLTFSEISETNQFWMLARVVSDGFESADLAFWIVFSSKVKNPHLLETDPLIKGTNVWLDLPNPEIP